MPRTVPLLGFCGVFLFSFLVGFGLILVGFCWLLFLEHRVVCVVLLFSGGFCGFCGFCWFRVLCDL